VTGAMGEITEPIPVTPVPQGEPETAQEETDRSCNPSNQEMRHSRASGTIFPARRTTKKENQDILHRSTDTKPGSKSRAIAA
jgi:hypothetical protein